MGKPHLEELKHKVASEVGVNLTKDFNGDITTREAGLIGGNMVKELIMKAKEDLTREHLNETNSNNWSSMNNNIMF